MALYSYEAFSKAGKRVKGVLDASSVAGVKEQLVKQGLFPISVSLTQQEAQYGFFQRLFMGSVSVKDKVLLTKQFAILLKSGIPLLQAVELLTEQFEGRLRSILVAVKDDIKEGSSLADALAKYPRVFDNIYIQLVRAGEASGRLEVILERLTQFLERQEAVSKKIRGALQQPIMQFVMAIGVVIFLLTFVVPQMAESFSEQNMKLPLPTRVLLSLSHFILGHYLVLILGIFIIFFVYKYWSSTASGMRRLDKIKLRLPLIGRITRTGAVVQFCYTLGMLLEGGVNLAQALDIVCSIIDNSVLADALKKARDNIVKQGKIAEYLKQTGVFPPIAIYLMSTGEQSGQLDNMLLIVARNYEIELEELIDGFTAKIGPIMLVLMGLIVGFIIMSVMLPIMTQMQAQSR